MKTGMKAIAFPRRILRDDGIDKKIFIEMLEALPEDAKICGFGEYSGEDVVSILVESAEFYSKHNEGSAYIDEDFYCAKWEEKGD
jgi:hypothetical protein